MGNSSRVSLEVEHDDYNSGVDEEKLCSDVIRNLRRAPRADNQDESHNASVWMMTRWVRTKTLQLFNGTL